MAFILLPFNLLQHLTFLILLDNFKIVTFHEHTDVFIAQLTPEIIKGKNLN